jgi:endonuclease YncB( thermonuclease family)
MVAGIALLASSLPAVADDLIGQASIIDGDSLEIYGNRIRLRGIDAHETTQLCRGDDSEQYRCGGAGCQRPRRLHREAPGELQSDQS